MVTTPEEERWAEALAVVRDHGEGAVLHAIERVAALSLAGDMAGVVRWQAIAAKLDQLTRRGGAVH